MNFKDTIKLTITRRDTFLIFRTYQPGRGSSEHFLISKDAMWRWFGSEDHTLLDMDGSSFVRMFCHEDTVHVTFTWVHTNWSGDITGYTQSFSLDTQILIRAMYGERDEQKLLIHLTPYEQSKVVFTKEAQRSIGQMDKLERRALSKLLRGAFRWEKRKVITVYPDFGKDLCFTESGENGISGGICYHSGSMFGLDGSYHPLYRFSVHT